MVNGQLTGLTNKLAASSKSLYKLTVSAMEDVAMSDKLSTVLTAALPRKLDRVRVRLRAERCGARSAVACADGVGSFIFFHDWCGSPAAARLMT